jgi:hypothetical protein
VNFSNTATAVIPAAAGIQVIDLMVFQGRLPYELDSGVRRNDGRIGRRQFFIASAVLPIPTGKETS